MHFNANTSLRIPLKTSPSTPVGLDYNFRDGKVYWTDLTLDTISRAFLNGSSQETIVSSRIESPYGLAVDPFGQNVYWADYTEDTIEVASLNGLYRHVLIKNDLQSPRDIALDVTRGYGSFVITLLVLENATWIKPVKCQVLRSNSAIRHSIPLEKGIFQDSAAKIFSSFPDHLRMCDDFGHFCRDVNHFFLIDILRIPIR